MRRSLFALAAILILSGCNTYFQKSYQSITVNTLDAASKDIENADCVLETGKHKYRTLTPRPINIERSDLPMKITCEKVGYHAASVTISSKIRMAASQLNVMNGLVPATFYDVISNSIYDYPDLVLVTLKEDQTVEMNQDPYVAPLMLKKVLEVKPLPAPTPVQKAKTEEAVKKDLGK